MSERNRGILRALASVLTVAACSVVMASAAQAQPSAQPHWHSTVVRVPATANPWKLDGSPGDGTAALVVPIHTPAHSMVQFPSVTGTWGFTGGLTQSADGRLVTPEISCGGPHCEVLPSNGLSGIRDGRRFWFLAGIFVGKTLPATAPATLVFTRRHDFRVIAPLLGQAFFIGDGQTDRGFVQQFRIPVGATRLLLGMPDVCSPPSTPSCYFDNSGTLTVSAMTVPAQ